MIYQAYFSHKPITLYTYFLMMCRFKIYHGRQENLKMKKVLGSAEMFEEVKCLLSKHEDLSLIPRTYVKS